MSLRRRAGSCPALGASTPVSRLISVVLPAPFGPISAWRAPRSQPERDVVGGGDAAEALHQARASPAATSLIARRLRSRPPPREPASSGRISRSRPTSTSTTRNRPIQKVQYCGVSAESDVVQQLEGDGADDAAIQVAGAADHQHQQHVGAAVEVEHVERREAAWSAPAARRPRRPYAAASV